MHLKLKGKGVTHKLTNNQSAQVLYGSSTSKRFIYLVVKIDEIT